MIEYINPSNMDDRIIIRAKNILEDGGIIAYPTDTSWGIGCSSHSEKGISKLKKLKGDFYHYTLTLICSSISQINGIAELNDRNFKIIKRYTPGPFVFILPALRNIEKKVNMKRIEIGVRIPGNPVPVAVINTLGLPIFSMTASKIMTDRGWWDEEYAEENLFQEGWELEDIPGIDLILDAGEPLSKVLSTVIDLTTEDKRIIRQGIGVFSE